MLQTTPAWVREIKRFEKPNRGKAIMQLANTLLPLTLVWAAALFTLRMGYPYVFTLFIILIGSLLMVRAFIIFHDTAHASFFKSLEANAFWGHLLGVLVFTPYDDWRQSHGIHHNTNGNLDRRGVGDVWTKTLEEYRQSPRHVRLLYRLFRNPFLLFLVYPPIMFLVLHRIPLGEKSPRVLLSLVINNLGIAAFLAAIWLLLGWDAVLLIHLPMFYFASIAGVWLFYVQHQFDPGYWERNEDWNNIDAALDGSSHYKLNPVLQWFTGNIGLHHIHHVRPRIPNYNLQECYDATPELQLPNPLTFFASMKAIHKHLWDETAKKLVGFKEVRRSVS